MNIKVVFENKIHLLPASLNNFNQIKENIKCLYPKLRKNFEIYTQVLPKQTPFKINNEDHFNQLKQLYGHLKFKFIIKNSQQDHLEQEEIQALNQSIIAQYNNGDKQLQDIHQNFNDINTKSNQQIQQSNIEKLIIELVDQRLEFFGLIKQEIQPIFKMKIEHSPSTVFVIPGKQFLWSVCLRNTSNVKWLKEDVYLKCIEGQFLHQKLFFNIDIPINELCTLGIKLIAPKRLDDSPQIFQLFHQQQHFGKPIIFKLQLTESLQKKQQASVLKLEIQLQKIKLRKAKKFFQRLNGYQIRQEVIQLWHQKHLD
ncbi:unnamed protein product [Paramecium pentaurelia]|uniref:Uncharacterized protein n=1 Tax=Paramecium pentaurelia TaxID=43138 RepID=A0A8S1SGS7_9CILI|nr:unnamed protein product [Paramecium pentaurelia]